MAWVGVDPQAVAPLTSPLSTSSPVSGFLQNNRTAASSEDVNVATTGCSGGRSRPLMSAFMAASIVSASPSSRAIEATACGAFAARWFGDDARSGRGLRSRQIRRAAANGRVELERQRQRREAGEKTIVQP